MTGMLMSHRNRRGKEVCAYGCCDTAHSGQAKKKARRRLKRIERRMWLGWE